jgi:hypothetical protein
MFSVCCRATRGSAVPCPPMFPPALRTSVLSEGQEVSVRPRAASTSTTVTVRGRSPLGLARVKKVLRKTHRVGVHARGVRIHYSAGQQQPVIP